MPVPKEVIDILKKIKDPHLGKDIVTAKIVRNIKVKGKTVHMKLVPPGMGCEVCGIIHQIMEEIKVELKKKGYTADIEF